MAHTPAQKRQAYWRKQELVWEYKAKVGCEECGENDPVVLDLHHPDPSTKHPRLKQRSKGNTLMCLPWADLLLELEKCVVLCSNCHRRVEYALRKGGE